MDEDNFPDQCHPLIKSKKKKIFISNGIIRNKGCDKWLAEAKLNNKTASDRGKKGANARWNGSSNAQAISERTYHLP